MNSWNYSYPGKSSNPGMAGFERGYCYELSAKGCPPLLCSKEKMNRSILLLKEAYYCLISYSTYN